MLLKDFIAKASARLSDLYPGEEARSVVMVLVEDLLGVKRFAHVVNPGLEVPPEREEELLSALSRLEKGEPVQYVTGAADFCGRRFKVDSSTLIPRPETEELCEEALRRLHGPCRVLDLCTGSGCIAWTVALGCPGASVMGIDISAEALSVAGSQKFDMPAGSKAPEFVRADVLDTSKAASFGKFDAILSNPPYIMEKEKASMRVNVLDYEPASALFVSDSDPLVFYRAIAEWSLAALVPGGFGITEINQELGSETLEIFTSKGFSAGLVKDFRGNFRFISYSK